MLSNRFGKISAWITLGMLGFLLPMSVCAQNLPFLSDTTQYLWPTNASPYISSTFGETRSAHFHAGLDIRTWGREGYNVYATRDGVVERLGISPRGYGKVIYLKHEDGSYSLYAHLSRFEPALQAVADSIRILDYSFELDRNISHHNIRVQQGDLIGFTGSTGVGPPHLHFELRTPDHEPFNPLYTNLTIDDDLPPVFSSLAAEHLNPNTFHSEQIDRKRPQVTDGHYDFGTIEVSGPVGLAVDVYDRANRTSNAYAAYTLTMIHEGDTLFHSVKDRFSYQTASQMFIDRIYPLLKMQRRGYQRLYIVNGNSLSFPRKHKKRGVVDLPEGEHKITIVAGDFFGNKSEATVTLQVRERSNPVASEIKSIPAYPLPESSPERDAINSSNRLNGRSIEPAYFANINSPGPADTEPQINPGAIDFYRNKSSKIITKILTPGNRHLLSLPDQSIWLDFPEDALFDTLHLHTQIQYSNGLPNLRFSPELIPFNNDIQINILLSEKPDSSSKIGLYSYNQRRDRYQLVEPAGDQRLIRASVGELREFIVMGDSTAPQLGVPRFVKGWSGHYFVVVTAEDELSGIDHKKSRITVNGVQGITEYDPEKNQLIYYHPGFQPAKENKVDIQAYDGVGNLTEQSFLLD